MKRIVETSEDSGFDAMIGERVTVWCLNYIYAGKLTGVNEKTIELSDASVVYETGKLSDKGYTTQEKTPNPVYVMMSCIESFTLEN